MHEDRLPPTAPTQELASVPAASRPDADGVLRFMSIFPGACGYTASLVVGI